MCLWVVTKQTKSDQLVINKNRYPQEIEKKTNILLLISLDKRKALGPEKCVVTLKFTCTNKSSEMLETKVKLLIRTTYYAANPRIIFAFKPLITLDKIWYPTLSKIW